MYGGAYTQPRERSRSPPKRGGDWFCPSCHDHQFAKNACCRTCGAPKPADPSQCGPPDAATFLADHIIDDAVLTRFLALTPDQQQVVIMRGSLAGARDPSAVLSSRVSQVIQGKMTAQNPNPNLRGGAMAGGMGGGGGCGDQNAMMQQMMMQQMQQMMGMAGGSVPGMPSTGMGGGNFAPGTSNIVPRNGDWYCQQCGDHQFAKNVLCRNCGAQRPTDGSEVNPPGPEKFLAVHPGLEEHAVGKFLALDPDQQLVVIKRGSLNGSNSPTAVLLGRIKTVQQQGVGASLGHGGKGHGGGHFGGKGGMNHAMGTGVPGNGIRPSADDWYCPNCYDLQFRNNDVCRICGTSREFGVKDISSLDPAAFLAGHKLEPTAVQQFYNLPEDQKKMVMSGGSLHGARDPTAVLINRMAKARSGGYAASQQGGQQLALTQGGMQQQQSMEMQQMQMMQQMMMVMQQQAQQMQLPSEAAGLQQPTQAQQPQSGFSQQPQSGFSGFGV